MAIAMRTAETTWEGQAALQQPGDTTLAGRVHRRAISAAALRGAIAALSLALIALGVLLAP